MEQSLAESGQAAQPPPRVLAGRRRVAEHARRVTEHWGVKTTIATAKYSTIQLANADTVSFFMTRRVGTVLLQL